MNSDQFNKNVDSVRTISLSAAEKEVMSETLKRYTENHTIPGKGNFLMDFLQQMKSVFAVRLRF